MLLLAIMVTLAALGLAAVFTAMGISLTEQSRPSTAKWTNRLLRVALSCAGLVVLMGAGWLVAYLLTWA